METITYLLLIGLWSYIATSEANKFVAFEMGVSESCPLVEKKKFHIDPNLKLNWYAAFMHCQSKGWRLATIRNKQENDEMLAHIRAKYPGDGTYREGIWLGGTELGSLGTWRWMATGQGWSFTDWLAGQPSNPESEHCLDLWTLKWNDATCELPLMFVCEYNTYEPFCVR